MPGKNYSGLEERTAKVEGILEQMDKRLDRVEVGIIDLKNEIKSGMGKLEVGLRAEFSKLDNRMNKLEIKVDNQFKWLVGIVVGMWITTISSVLSMFFYIIFKG